MCRYLNELLALVFECLPLPVHDGFQFFKVSKLDLQLLHLGLDQKCNQTLDLPLFNGCKVLGLHRGGSQSGRSGRLEIKFVCKIEN